MSTGALVLWLVAYVVAQCFGQWVISQLAVDSWADRTGRAIAHRYTRRSDHGRGEPCRRCGALPGAPCGERR